MDDTKVPGKMLHGVYPWLLPLIVSLVLVLTFCAAERLRSITPIGKFNRITFGMNRGDVLHIMGAPDPKGFRLYSGQALTPADEWPFDGFRVTVYYDSGDRVVSKAMTCDVRSTRC